MRPTEAQHKEKTYSGTKPKKQNTRKEVAPGGFMGGEHLAVVILAAAHEGNEVRGQGHDAAVGGGDGAGGSSRSSTSDDDRVACRCACRVTERA